MLSEPQQGRGVSWVVKGEAQQLRFRVVETRAARDRASPLSLTIVIDATHAVRFAARNSSNQIVQKAEQIYRGFLKARTDLPDPNMSL
jgi:hypothetical protein